MDMLIYLCTDAGNITREVDLNKGDPSADVGDSVY